MSTPAPKGVVPPFRRDRARDFVVGEGPALLRAKVLQILLTEGDTAQSSGELPWRTSFGSGVHLARHVRNDAALAELTRVRVRDALVRWLPGGGPMRVDVFAEHNRLRVVVGIGNDEIAVDVARSR
jgi:hypothetical protein